MSKRNVGIDYLRGICILIVVFVHTITFLYVPDKAAMFFEGLFLNGFYIVSGYFYSVKGDNDRALTQIKNRALTLLRPYLFLCLIGTVFQLALTSFDKHGFTSFHYTGMKLVLKNLVMIVTLNGVGPLWFLPMLFIGNVVIILLAKINSKVKNIIIILVIVLGLIAHEIITVRMDSFKGTAANQIMNFADRLSLAIAFVCLGYVIERILRGYKLSNLKYALGAIISLALCILFIYNKWPIHYVFTTMFMFLLAILIGRLNIPSIIRNIFMPLEYCGKNTIYIMAIHYFIWAPLGFVFVKKTWDNNNIWINILEFVLVVALSMITTFIVKKSKVLRFIFEGRRVGTTK